MVGHPESEHSRLRPYGHSLDVLPSKAGTNRRRLMVWTGLALQASMVIAVVVFDATAGDPPASVLVVASVASLLGAFISILAFALMRRGRKAIDGLGMGLSTFAGGLGAILWAGFAWLLNVAAAG